MLLLISISEIRLNVKKAEYQLRLLMLYQETFPYSFLIDDLLFVNHVIIHICEYIHSF